MSRSPRRPSSGHATPAPSLRTLPAPPAGPGPAMSYPQFGYPYSSAPQVRGPAVTSQRAGAWATHPSRPTLGRAEAGGTPTGWAPISRFCLSPTLSLAPRLCPGEAGDPGERWHPRACALRPWKPPGEGVNIQARRRWAPRVWRRPGALASWKGTRGPVWTVAAPPKTRSARPRGCAWGGRRPRGPAWSPGAPFLTPLSPSS